MALPLMPKATAVWLVDNTALTFDQIADFCGLHPLEVQGVADGEVAVGIVGLDPISTGQLTADALKAAETDPSIKLEIAETTVPKPVARAKGPRYTPVAKRQNRPNAIAWLLRYHPELTDGQVSMLVGTTKSTIDSLRDRTHWNMNNIKLEDPVSLGMCSQLELDTAVTKAMHRERARRAREDRETRKRKRETMAASGIVADETADLDAANDEAAEEPTLPNQTDQRGQPRPELWAGAAKAAEPAEVAPTADVFTATTDTSAPSAASAESVALERERVFRSPRAEPEAPKTETGEATEPRTPPADGAA